MTSQYGRRDNRNAVEWKAKIGGKGLGIKSALVRNVSLSGMYIETFVGLKVQDTILLECHVEHIGKARRLFVECEVMRCASAESSDVQGYGVRFMKLGRDNLSFLLPLVAELHLSKPMGIQDASIGKHGLLYWHPTHGDSRSLFHRARTNSKVAHYRKVRSAPIGTRNTLCQPRTQLKNQ